MPTVDHALAYARIGWPVFPCRGKMPCEKNSHGVNDATTDEARIRRWWARHRDANIGLAAGLSWFALDVDGKTGEDSLRTLIDRFGEIPDTLQQFTGGGGAHLLFRPVDGLKNWASRFCIDGEYVELPGLDVRTKGAAIIGAPSVHGSGALYRWKKGHGPRSMLHGDIEIATAPAWLIRICTPPPENVVRFNSHREATGAPGGNLPRYIDAALQRACEAVSGAMPGTQEPTLHREAFSIGGLVGEHLSADHAFDALVSAGMRMRNGDAENPWTPRKIADKVRNSLRAGMSRPRQPVEMRR